MKGSVLEILKTKDKNEDTVSCNDGFRVRNPENKE